MAILPAMTSHNKSFAFTCFNAHRNSDTVVIYRVHSESYQIDTLKLFTSGICQLLTKNRATRFKSIALWDSTIVLGTYNRLFIFHCKENNIWSHAETQKISFDYQKMKMVDYRTILFMDAYHSRRKHKTTLLLYDIEQGKTLKTIHPYLNSTLNTYYSNNSYADYCDGRIIWTHNNEYSLVEFNHNLQPVDSIHYEQPDWKPLPDSIVCNANKIPWTDAVDIIHTIQNKNVSSDIIMWVLFLSKDTLMVVRKKPTLKYKLIDLWSHTEGKWQPLLCGISDAGYWRDFQSVVKDHLQIGFSAGDYVSVCGNKLFVLTSLGWTESFGSLSGTEYAKQRENYLLDNDYFVQLRVYTYNFDSQQ